MIPAFLGCFSYVAGLGNADVSKDRCPFEILRFVSFAVQPDILEHPNSQLRRCANPKYLT
jgi:hypothetical protein